MSIYPPNQTTPKSGNYVWNWLGSSIKKFAQALSPYISGGSGDKLVAGTKELTLDDGGSLSLNTGTLYISADNGILLQVNPQVQMLL